MADADGQAYQDAAAGLITEAPIVALFAEDSVHAAGGAESDLDGPGEALFAGAVHLGVFLEVPVIGVGFVYLYAFRVGGVGLGAVFVFVGVNCSCNLGRIFLGAVSGACDLCACAVRCGAISGSLCGLFACVFALVCGFAGGGFRCRCSLCAVATVAYAGGGGLFAGRFAFQGLSAVLGRNPGRIYIGFVLLGENGGAEQCQKRQRQCKLGKFHKPNYNKKGPERCVFSKFNPEKFNEAAAA